MSKHIGPIPSEEGRETIQVLVSSGVQGEPNQKRPTDSIPVCEKAEARTGPPPRPRWKSRGARTRTRPCEICFERNSASWLDGVTQRGDPGSENLNPAAAPILIFRCDIRLSASAGKRRSGRSPPFQLRRSRRDSWPVAPHSFPHSSATCVWRILLRGHGGHATMSAPRKYRIA